MAAANDHSLPLPARNRAIFQLRAHGTPEAVAALCGVLKDKAGTSLYRHEVAFLLGQIGDDAAVCTLTDVLRDVTDCPVTRHECGEALAAVGDPAAVAVLRDFLHDGSQIVADTCHLALARLEYVKDPHPDEKLDDSPYDSVDPAPADVVTKTVPELRAQFLDASRPLFDRYRAMFSLRNRGTPECVAALAEGFTDSSALLRHELAYVFGQLQKPDTVKTLEPILRDASEQGIVRHEAAEALGAICTDAAVALLQEFKDDPDVIVRESCEVALDVVVLNTTEAA